MGIKNLFKIIKEHAPNSIKEKKIKDFKNQFIVLDASMIIYQFVIAIRSTGQDLTNDEGKITTHILGVINKALMLLKNDIIPIFVFDGKAPDIKHFTLKKRKKTKKKCIDNLEKNEYDDEKDRIRDFKRSYTASREQIGEVKEILKLFGLPVIESDTEADPLCGQLVKQKLAYGVSSEDMDILTFGSPILIRGLSGTKKANEINLKNVLKELEFSQDQFIDLCILLGCDYTPTIPKVGPKRAFDIIKQYKNIETFLKENTKYKIPENFNYGEARDFFKNPPINKVYKKDIKFKKPNYNKIKELMVDVYDFDLNTVNKYINKIKKNYIRLVINKNKLGNDMSRYIKKKNI